VTQSTRDRIAAAFDRDLDRAPVPPGLRERSVHAAVAAPRSARREPRLLALVAAVIAIALVATLVLTHLHQTSVPVVKPSGPPPARSEAGVVYDGARNQLFVFGGNTAPAQLVGDTWTSDGKGWTQHHPASSPQPRAQATVAYDEPHHVVVLYGGRGNGPGVSRQPVDFTDTWTWDGSTWTQKHPAHSPAFNEDWPATMGFDPVSRTVLLYGFAKIPSGSGSTIMPETWSWNGSDWAQLSPAVTPESSGDMFSDGRHLFLSTPPVDAGSHAQISEWDGRSWIAVSSENELPTDSGVGSAAFDVHRDQLVMLNGDTWIWDRSHWLRMHPDQQAPTGYMVYFASLHAVVSWGDRWGASSNELWAWNGSNWKLMLAGTVTVQPTPAGHFGPTTPAAAEALIRQTVKASSPVLMPGWLPAGLESNVDATPDYFTVTYRSDQRDKEITFGIVLASPPPGGANAKDSAVRFRNSGALKYGHPGYAEYFVYDTTDPLSARYLMWIEPGTMANPQTKEPGVPYFLGASGLTDQEFWQVANSLR
jgi:hypothetical protein